MRKPIGYNPPVDCSRRRFVCYFWRNGWDNIQLGLHISLSKPNLEIHVPFGFFRIGWDIMAAANIDGKTLNVKEALKAIGHKCPK